MSLMITKNFSEAEFRCGCCGRVVIDNEFVTMLQNARDRAGIPFRITSGYRCQKHNAEVGGMPNSLHLTGRAADIEVSQSHDRFVILKSLLNVGFNRVGIGRDFIHVDSGGNGKDECVVWLY